MPRNNYGIITTPRIDINGFITESGESYEDTEFEKVVDVILKSIKFKKLLCIDLYDGTFYNLFGITNVIFDDLSIYFECGGVGLNTGTKYIFNITLSTKVVTIEKNEV